MTGIPRPKTPSAASRAPASPFRSLTPKATACNRADTSASTSPTTSFTSATSAQDDGTTLAVRSSPTSIPPRDTNAATVQVAVRIRPLDEQDRTVIPARWQHPAIWGADGCVRVDASLGPGGGAAGGVNSQHAYDCVLGPETTQAHVYSSSVQPLITRFLEGYNATVFAYGHTNSGKSYTMGTGVSQPYEEGIIPRALSEIFAQRGDEHWSISFIELYNDDLVDLLAEDASSKPQLQIQQDKGQMVWSGMRRIAVQSAQEAMELLHQGTARRQTHPTEINPQSSRSHAMFSLCLTVRFPSGVPTSLSDGTGERSLRPSTPHRSLTIGSNRSRSASQATKAPTNDIITTTQLHFVDLAGSDRLKRTGTQDRTKEGISINADLSALGNVISALSTGAKHVPYRDSKLTRLLQDSLGGNAHTLMIACVSPAAYNVSESLTTLGYASKARNIHNTPSPVQGQGWNEVRSAQQQGSHAEMERDASDTVWVDYGDTPNTSRSSEQEEQSQNSNPTRDALLVDLCAQQERIRALEVQVAAQQLLPPTEQRNSSHNDVELIRLELSALQDKYSQAMVDLNRAQRTAQLACQRSHTLAAPRSRAGSTTDDAMEVLHASTALDEVPATTDAGLARRNSTGTRKQGSQFMLRSHRSDLDEDGLRSLDKEHNGSTVSRRPSLTFSGTTVSSRTSRHGRSNSGIMYRPADSAPTTRDLNDVSSSRQTSPDDMKHTRTPSRGTHVRPLSLVSLTGLTRTDPTSPTASPSPEEAQRKIRSLEQERDTLQALLIQRDDELDQHQSPTHESASVHGTTPVHDDTPELGHRSAQSTLVTEPEESDGSSARGSMCVHELLAQLASQENQHKDALAKLQAELNRSRVGTAGDQGEVEGKQQQHETELEALHARLTQSELHHKDELERLKVGHETALSNLQDEHNQAYTQKIESDLTAALESSHALLATKLKEKDEAYTRELNKLEAIHATQLAQHAEDHQKQLVELQKSHQATVDQLNARITQLTAQCEVDPVDMDVLRSELVETSDALVVLEGALTEAQAERDQYAAELEELGSSTPSGSGNAPASSIAQTRADLSRARTEASAAQADCARKDALLRDTQQRLALTERIVAAQSGSLPRHGDDSKARSCDASPRFRLSSSSGTGLPPPLTPPPARPPPPTPSEPSTQHVLSSRGRTTSMAETLSSPGEPTETMGFTPIPPPTVSVSTEEHQRIQEESKALQAKFAQFEVAERTSSEMIKSLEAAHNDSERNLRKARTQLTEVTRERDAFSGQSIELQAKLEAATNELEQVQAQIKEQRDALQKEIDQERQAREKAREALSARLEEATHRKTSRLFCL